MRNKRNKSEFRSIRQPALRAMEPLEKRAMLAAHIVGSTTNFATIQAAVDAAAVGATINVDAGTYAETVTINKSLTLRGAQAGVDGRSTRGAESIVYATPTDFKIIANDVTIDGFTIKGYQTNIGAGLGAGVIMGASIHGTHVVNNIFTSNITGLYLSNNSNTDAAVIQHNYFHNDYENGSDWTYGWNGSREIYTDGSLTGGLLTNVLIDGNSFRKDGAYTGEGMIALSALSAGKQFNITITNNNFSSSGVSSKALLAFNVTNLSFIGNTATGQNDGSSGPVRFEGNANNVNIQYNSIHDNAGPGVAADSSGAAGDSSGFVVNNNNIYNQNGIGVLTIASVYNGPLYALNNWWGNASGPGGDGPGTGQAVWANGVSGHYTNPTGAPGGDPRFTPWATALIDTTAIPVPAAPSALGAVAVSSSQVSLNWTAPSSTASWQFVQRSTDGTNFTTVATVPPLLTSYSDGALTAGTAYTYRVIAANNTGSSAASATAVATTYAANANNTPLSSLSWTSATTGYGTVQKDRSIKGNVLTLKGVAYGTGIGTHAASTITYALNGAYSTFQSDVGIDDEENGVGVGSVDFKVIGDGVTLFDSGNIGNGTKASINVSVVGVQTLSLVATNGVSGVIDYDHADWAGAQLLVVPSAPAAPINVTATALTQGSISFAWTAVGTNQTGFKIERSTDGTTWTAPVAVGSAVTSFTDTGLTAGTTYSYRVRATNAVGDSANSAVASATTFVPGTATKLADLPWTSATAGFGTVQKNKSIKGNGLSLKGKAYPTGLGTHAASTIVYDLGGQYTAFVSDIGIDDEENGVGTGSVKFQLIGDGNVLYDSGILTNTSPTISLNVGVTGVQKLSLVVINGVAGSIDFDHADWAGAQLIGTPSLPSAPTSLVATATGSSSIKLNWNAGGTNQTGYAVDRSTDGVTFTTIATGVAGGMTTWTDTSVLSASTKYYYRIRASNIAGDSANSGIASATTLALQTVTYLSDLSWTTATVGYGTIQKDASIKGNPLKLNGVTYARGIGTHAASSISYNLAGKYSTFLSDVGIDDEELGVGVGSVDFTVLADGKVVYDSGVITSGMPTASINLSVAGVQTLTLIANNGVAGSIDFDHADWAGARFLV